MSSHDGGRHEDGFCVVPNAELTQMLGQSAPAAQQAAPPPPTQLMMGAPFIQPSTHPQPQQQPLPPQPSHYNEYFYNMYATPPGQPETYSVLPVGHGNFLKVYHCPENTASGLTNDGSTLYQTLQSHQPFQSAYHMAQTQATPTQYYNSYELFSSNTLMPTPDNQIGLGREMATSSQQVQQSHQAQSQTQGQTFLLNSVINHEEQHSAVPPPSAPQTPSSSTANVIINKLVNNWSPNLTGAPIQLPTQTAAAPAETEQQLPAQCVASKMSNDNLNSMPNVMHHFSVQSKATSAPIATPILPQQLLLTPPMPAHMETTTSSNYTEAGVNIANAASMPPPVVGATTSSGSPTGINNNAPEVKKRIVAEVKPMRMTYSDVLSKINNQQTASAPLLNTKNAAGKNNKTANTNALLNDRKNTENKSNGESGNGNGNNNGNGSGNGSVLRRQAQTEESGAMQSRPVKKSPTHENKENVQQLQGAANNSKNSKRTNNNSNANNSNINSSNSGNNAQTKPVQKSQKLATGENSNANGNNGAAASNKKRNSNKRIDGDGKEEAQGNSKSQKNGSVSSSEKHFNGFYNVTAKHNDNFERSSNKTTSANATANVTNARKSTTGKSNSNYYPNSSNSFNANQSRSRYSNSTSNSSYLYSSKRGGRGANFSSCNAGNATTNRNYELAKKFLRTWLEYTIKILAWLYYLIYDIVVLGCSMVYDRLTHAYETAMVYMQQWRKEWKQNSNKPHVWLKNCWRRFDARFKKNSRWAFWRHFYKKKPPETTAENFKSGRLPQTGEEAMYSLLNCKGKDAYSILGVPADSSQEQIRKHYKKIAVLVHPDKNKQAGAEEAFKVLQRAFELIGEPEKRLAYDQSLAEALHTEKAWTELHDLISQLKTKITEAANTIRCSTCGLRHPRRLTDRPHYAARQCASCKIRHSAREGDIWAETSLLGLRWKYLALMEGKVYDITEWANCQKGALSHLEPNSHMVQYRIVRGAQQQQQQQAQQQAHQHHSPHHQSRQQFPQHAGTHHERSGSGKFKRNVPTSEASLHEFLDNLYSGQNPNQTNPPAYANPTRRRTRRN